MVFVPASFFFSEQLRAFSSYSPARTLFIYERIYTDYGNKRKTLSVGGWPHGWVRFQSQKKEIRASQQLCKVTGNLPQAENIHYTCKQTICCISEKFRATRQQVKRHYFECQGLAHFPALLCKNHERRTCLAQKHCSVLAMTSALLGRKLHNTNTGLLSVTVYDDIDHFSRPVNSKKKILQWHSFML